MRQATTFGASKVIDEDLYNEGVLLGEFLAKQNFTVKCGGYGGLMEAVSKGVSKARGKVIGIGLKEFEYREQNIYLTEKIIAKDLFERLRLLIEGSEIFIIQQGSIGTLNELFMVWAIKYGLGKNFRICLIGQHYQKLINCDFIDKDRLKEIEIYKNLDEFKGYF
jgi:uncharacterized protein (TIGR00725 family)